MNLSVKNVPEDVVQRLRERARRNRRSLQGELLTILEENAGVPALSVRELHEHVQRLSYSTPSEAVDIIRELRDSR